MRQNLTSVDYLFLYLYNKFIMVAEYDHSLYNNVPYIIFYFKLIIAVKYLYTALLSD